MGLGFMRLFDKSEVKEVKDGEQIHQSAWEFFVLGSILFIPGSYHTFIAIMACKKVPGYEFDQVSIFDEDLNNDD